MESDIRRYRDALEVIKALSDSTRRKMLLEIERHSSESNGEGLTASTLSDILGKKIPTILHHLKVLEKADLAYWEMQPIASGGREVKHWKIKTSKVTLELDLGMLTFSFAESIFRLFEEEKGAGGLITEQFGSNLTIQSIMTTLGEKFPDLTEQQAENIRELVSDPNQLEKYLEEWIYWEFVNSKGVLQLNFFEFGEYFALDRSLQGSLYKKLVHSENFRLDNFDEDGQIIQRLSILPAYVRAYQT